MGTVALILGSMAFGALAHRIASTRSTKVPLVNWTELPSGWTRSFSSSVTIYATVIDGKAYWWVSRRGRTIVEGPSRSLEAAKVEAEREAYALTRP